jgi:ABC-2 type transport system ATP-binding protein
MAVLQALQLGKQYNGKAALSNLNLSIEKGEIFCFLGQNGAGKIATINLFLGFTNATSGEAKINNVTVQANDIASKRFVVYIPEVVQPYGNLDGIENLDFFSRLAGFKIWQGIAHRLLVQSWFTKRSASQKNINLQ